MNMNVKLLKNGGNTFKIHSTQKQVKENRRGAAKNLMIPPGFIVSTTKEKSNTENSILRNNAQDFRSSKEYKASLELLMENKGSNIETNMFKFSNKPKRKRIDEKNNKKKEDSNYETLIQKKVGIKRLPQELLKSLSEQPLQKNKSVPLETKVSVTPEKKKKKLKLKSTVLEEGYIPLSAEGATQFALTRLDKEPLLSSAQQALNFRNNQLYGPHNRRISAKDLHNLKQKYKINNTF